MKKINLIDIPYDPIILCMYVYMENFDSSGDFPTHKKGTSLKYSMVGSRLFADLHLLQHMEGKATF